MSRYHLNPATGDPGVCRAKQSCPFGDMDTDHYDSPEQARSSFEAKQDVFKGRADVVEYDHEVPLDADTLVLLDRLASKGAQPLVVGGAVRDSLESNTIPKDVDIEVHGVQDAEELLTLLQTHGYKVDEVGKSFGVLTTRLPNGMDIDVSLPRRDSLVGESHRDFEVVVDTSLTLSEAAARRDFTINALYYDHRNKKVLDAHNGMKDWEARRLQHVSDAFAEDPLRVLRAVQFASRFNLDITPETAAESQRISDKFDTISTERVQGEWRKLFTKGKSLKHGLKTLAATGWDRHFGLDKVNIEQAAQDADAAMAAAKDSELEYQIYAAGALAKHLPVEERLGFLKQTVIGEKEANKMLRLGQVEQPLDLTLSSVKRWARNDLKDNGGSVKEWMALNGHTLNEPGRDLITYAAKHTGSWDGPKPDFITGQMILDGVGTKRGGPWVGQLQREAQQAQDREVFLDQEQADNWLRQRLSTFTVPEPPARRK